MNDAVALRWKRLGSEAQAALTRFIEALKFDPDQPRDERGRWVETDERSSDDENAAIVPVSRRRNARQEAECEEQHKRDIFHCRMVGLPSCYAQANFRYSACLRGDPIPPLSY